jgi:uncharacterized RDD family membrane protein YckC
VTVAPGPPPAAELDRRFYAFTIDRLVAWVVDAIVALLAWRYLIDRDRVLVGVLVILATVVLVGAVLAVVLGLTGSSPGKAAVGLRVVDDATGRPVGVGRGLLRQLILGVATLPTFGLGVATLAWTAAMDPGGRRRGWHDKVTHCEEVDVRPVPIETVTEDRRPRHVVNLTAMRLVPAPAPVTTPARSPRPPAGPPPAGPPAPVAAAPVAPPRPDPAVRAPVPAPTPAPAREPVESPSPRQQLGYPLLPEPASPAARWRVSFDSGESFVVEGLALVGRRPEARAGEPVRHLVALRSTDMSLSKTHAQFQVVADGVLVAMDRGSTNGSILIRQGVARELTAGRPMTLLDGDRVRFGDREMSVVREA